QLRVVLPAGTELSPLREAWRSVAARHDVLRTGFLTMDDGTVLQCVRHAVDVPVTISDWRECEVDYEQRLAALRRNDLAQGFDPRQPPLLRITLVRRPDQQVDMIWTHHHVLTDGWSSARVLDEVMVTYQAFRSGSEPAFVPVPPFRDYVVWLRRQPSGEAW